MRDINRISRVMVLLEKIWTAHPDMRFNQLLDSIQRSYMNDENKSSIKVYYDMVEYRSYTTYTPVGVVDLFNLEDDKFEAYLQKLVEKTLK